MTDFQRIFVVGTQIGDDDVAALRKRLGKVVTVLVAPTGDAKRVVQVLGHEATPDVMLAPERFPGVDRGHRLDELVRRHALADRQRDVVVVADPATVTLLLRVMAPGQLPERGPVTVVSLPRAATPVSLVHVAAGGVLLAALTGLLATVLPFWLLPGLVDARRSRAGSSCHATGAPVRPCCSPPAPPPWWGCWRSPDPRGSPGPGEVDDALASKDPQTVPRVATVRRMSGA